MSFDALVTTGDSSISGYLYKQTKDGRWQRRWFETNGNYLTYYKSRKMEKLLAALSMPQVGEVKTLLQDGETGLFCMELNSRVYTLRAKSNEEAEQWVAILLKLKKQGVSGSQSPMAEHALDARLSNSQEPGRASWMKTGKYCGCC